jgi:phosphate transport system substrate-binding protein
MKTFVVLLALAPCQERPSPDLLEYQPVGTLKGKLELGPPAGFEGLLTRWADRMKQHYPDVRGGQIESTPFNTTKALITGSSRIGLLTRRWTEWEAEDFRIQWGTYPVELAVGGDAIRIVVHPENPIRAISLEQLDSIYSSVRKRGGKPVQTWGDLGLPGEWKRQPVRLHGVARGSAAQREFQQRVLQGGTFQEGLREHSAAGSVLATVAEDPGAIGYLSGVARSDEIRVVPVQLGPGAPAVEPKAETILSLSYPRSYSDSGILPLALWRPWEKV